MNWFLLNMPLAGVFLGAWAGIPLWLTFKHPVGGPSFAAAGAHVGAEAALAEDEQSALAA